MNLEYLKLWVRTLINEEINKDQLTSVAGVLKKREDILRGWINDTDPTPNKSFSVWLLRGLKKQWIRMEDKGRITPLLQRFIQLRNSNKIGDIMQYPHINDLENAIEDLAGEGAKRQGFSGTDPSTLPGVSVFKETPEQHIVFYKVSDPTSLGKLGEGTKWCTRTSYDGSGSMANRYINQYGYLIVGYKHGKPYIQFNPDYSQIMDVNDVNFERSNPKAAKTLGLPMPKVSSKYSMTVSGEEPRDVAGLRRWAKLTGQPIQLPHKDPGFDDRFEKRLSKSILNAQSYIQLLRVMKGWNVHFENIQRRTPEVEKAIVDKDWGNINMRYFGQGGKMRHIPGMYEIAKYVKDIVKGHWPEFENKIETDTFNSILYYHLTKLSPDYVKTPLTKTIILYMQAIEKHDPKISTPEFQENMRKLLVEARNKLSTGEFNQVAAYVLGPYIKKTGRKLKDILGPDYKSKFYTGYVGNPHKKRNRD